MWVVRRESSCRAQFPEPHFWASDSCKHRFLFTWVCGHVAPILESPISFPVVILLRIPSMFYSPKVLFSDEWMMPGSCDATDPRGSENRWCSEQSSLKPSGGVGHCTSLARPWFPYVPFVEDFVARSCSCKRVSGAAFFATAVLIYMPVGYWQAFNWITFLKL